MNTENNSISICQESIEEVTFTVSNGNIEGYIYQWFDSNDNEINNVNESSYTLNVTDFNIATYTYAVVAKNNEDCISDTLIFTLTINALPNANAGLDQTICIGDEISLTASGGNNYIWSDDLGNTADITVSPTATTIYTVEVTNENGCTAADSVLIIVNNTPTAGITTNDEDQTICQGENISLEASGGNPYVWSTGAEVANINVSPTETTTYNVTVTNENNCTGSNNIIINVKSNPEKTEETTDFSTDGCLLTLGFNVAVSIDYENNTYNFIANTGNVITLASGTNVGTLTFIPTDDENYCNLNFDIGTIACSAECPTTPPNLTAASETNSSICISSDNPTFSIDYDTLPNDYALQWFDGSENEMANANAENYQPIETMIGSYNYSVQAIYNLSLIHI